MSFDLLNKCVSYKQILDFLIFIAFSKEIHGKKRNLNRNMEMEMVWLCFIKKYKNFQSEMVAIPNK